MSEDCLESRQGNRFGFTSNPYTLGNDAETKEDVEQAPKCLECGRSASEHFCYTGAHEGEKFRTHVINPNP